jgi:hypothetical protein
MALFVGWTCEVIFELPLIKITQSLLFKKIKFKKMKNLKSFIIIHNRWRIGNLFDFLLYTWLKLGDLKNQAKIDFFLHKSSLTSIGLICGKIAQQSGVEKTKIKATMAVCIPLETQSFDDGLNALNHCVFSILSIRIGVATAIQ